ncbi:putative amino-acid permease [Schizosaccharomyces pombe]
MSIFKKSSNTAPSQHEDVEALASDEADLAALGYKQEFKREFSAWTSFCVSFSVLGLLPSFASTMYYTTGYAGTPAMVWGWLIAMVFVQCVANGMAELCSSMPTSGGLYYAAAVLAPKGWGPFAAWLTGWSNYLVQVTGPPSVAYSFAGMILTLVQLHNPNFETQNYQIFLLAVAAMIAQGFISSMPTKVLAVFNTWGTVFNMLFLAIVMITVLAVAGTKTPRGFNSNHKVWNEFDNQTDWSNGMAMLMSFAGVIWTMSGYDSPFHLSEECSNASVAAPRAIVMTSAFGGIVGWLLNLCIAYTIVDVNAAMNDDLGQPFVVYLRQVCNHKTTVALTSLTVICSFMMGQGCMVAASRVTYSYARDGVFPFSKYLAIVDKRTKTPNVCVWMNVVVGILCCLLIFAGEAAINAIFSVGAIAAFVAFTTPIFLRVFFVKEDEFKRGPWHLGKFSKINGYAACAFVLLMVPILCFPQFRGKDNTPDAMNWTCVVFGGPMLMVLIWWVVSARKWFKGPRLTIGVDDAVSEINVLEGVTKSDDDSISTLKKK